MDLHKIHRSRSTKFRKDLFIIGTIAKIEKWYLHPRVDYIWIYFHPRLLKKNPLRE